MKSEVNLEKRLQKKSSIIRIQNDNDLCMVRALLVAKAKLDNDLQDHQIRNHQRLMQTRLAQELHENTGVPLGLCELEQAKQFQAYLTDYQFSIVSKEYGNKIICAGPKTRRSICVCITIIMTSSPRCLHFLPAATTCNKPTIIRKTIGARVLASVVSFLPTAPR